MEINLVESEKDLVSILSLDDPMLAKQALENLDCTKAEWVQFILNFFRLGKDIFRVYAAFDNKKISAYMIAMNCMYPPISRSFMIIYQNFFGMKDNDGNLVLKRVLDKVVEWSKDNGAKKIVIQTEYPHINSRIMGFKEEKGTPMILEI